ncbi:hypothetical protein B4Q13_24680, partial [Lacticaseibacillus rhamnosus]
ADRAVRREDALRAIELIKSERRAILGGDVYVADGGRIESAYANWYSERRQNELSERVVARSCAETRAYITNYPDPPQGQALFVLVVEEGTER